MTNGLNKGDEFVLNGMEPEKMARIISSKYGVSPSDFVKGKGNTIKYMPKAKPKKQVVSKPEGMSVEQYKEKYVIPMKPELKDEEGEEWRPVPNNGRYFGGDVEYGNYYEISNFGRLRTINLQNAAKSTISCGYDAPTRKAMQFHLNQESGMNTCPDVKYMVADAFLGEHDPEDNMVIHIDGDYHNNRADNLRWVPRKRARGEEEPSSELSERIRRTVREEVSNQIKKKLYEKMNNVRYSYANPHASRKQRKISVSESLIRRIVREAIEEIEDGAMTNSNTGGMTWQEILKRINDAGVNQNPATANRTQPSAPSAQNADASDDVAQNAGQPESDGGIVNIGVYKFNPYQHTIEGPEKKIRLAPTANDLIELMTKNIGQVIPFAEIFEICGSKGDTGSLRVIINRINTIFDKGANGVCVKGVRGVGYMLSVQNHLSEMFNRKFEKYGINRPEELEGSKIVFRDRNNGSTSFIIGSAKNIGTSQYGFFDEDDERCIVIERSDLSKLNDYVGGMAKATKAIFCVVENGSIHPRNDGFAYIANRSDKNGNLAKSNKANEFFM